jgi:protein arginine kinase
MVVDDLVKHPGSWLSMEQDTGIVISSRVRLARNIQGVAFPGWAGEDECVRLCRGLRDALQKVPAMADALFLDMAKLNPVEKDVLKERHLISNEFAERGAGSCLAVTRDERIAVMINEEDHLRLQAISPGMDLSAVWEKVDAVDSSLEPHVEYAFSSALGYLTACPSNVGTGLRASVMLHMAGLRLMGEVEQVTKALSRMGFAVRGLLGEGSDAYGNMFQVSNQSTLGESESGIMERLIQVVNEAVMQEQNARARLMESRRAFVADQVGRAFGILTHANLVPSMEAVDLLSSLKLGVELGLVKGLTAARIHEIILLTQPGHMQKIASKVLDPQERDETRSGIIRDKLKGVSIVG